MSLFCFRPYFPFSSRWEELRIPKELIKEIQTECPEKRINDKNLGAIRRENDKNIVPHKVSPPNAIMKRSNLIATQTSLSSAPSTSKLASYWDQSTLTLTSKAKVTSKLPTVLSGISGDLAAPMSKKQVTAIKRPYQAIQSYNFPEVHDGTKPVIKFTTSGYKKTLIENCGEILQEKSVKYHQSILYFAPSLHVKFVAFKAAEIALNNDSFQVDELLSRWTKSDHLFKANQPWDVPETAGAEHRQLYQYVFERHLTEQLKFTIVAVPDADPEYLEDMIRQYQGNSYLIKHRSALCVRCLILF